MDVGAILENGGHHRQSLDGFGTHAVKADQPGQVFFDALRDQRFGLFGGQTGGLGLNDNSWGRELRKDVETGLSKPLAPMESHQQRQGQHHARPANRKADDASEHDGFRLERAA